MIEKPEILEVSFEVQLKYKAVSMTNERAER